MTLQERKAVPAAEAVLSLKDLKSQPLLGAEHLPDFPGPLERASSRLDRKDRIPRARLHKHRAWSDQPRDIGHLRKGKQPDGHMGNFIQCTKDRSLPISDVYSHHRVLTTCHLANIALRLGRKLNWDATSEQITGDEEANAWQSRAQRKGYEVV